MEKKMKMEKPIYLGFLSIEKTKNKDGYLGAILVTDLRGIPLEFRCTHPVKPTLIQKTLYGESLLPLIGSELSGKPLFKSLQNKPSCLFVNSEFLLSLRPDISVPVVFVKRAGETIETASDDESTKLPHRERLESPTGKFQPVMVISHSDYEDDFKKIKSLLGDSLKNMDALEPFVRINKAVEELAQQDSKFQ